MMAKLDIKLHPTQHSVLTSPAKVKVVCSGRGWGKTRLLRAAAIKALLTYSGKFDTESPCEVLIAAPTLKMAIALHWEPLINLFESLPLTRKIDRSKHIIYFHNNLPLLSLAGTDDGGERIRGKNLIFAGLEEYQMFPPKTWDEIITPCFRDPSGFYESMVIGTPKGRNSHFYKFHQKALENPNWKYFHYTSADNPFNPSEIREQARLTLPPSVFRQEYEASWEDFSGKLYDQFNESHTVDILPDSFGTILIGVDHGETNPAVSVIGIKDNLYYIIDCWSNPNPSIPVTQDEVIKQIITFCRKYKVHQVMSPDDRPSFTIALRRKGATENIQALKNAITVPRSKPGVMESIGIINSLFYQNRILVSNRLQSLIDDINSYHKAEDREGNILEKVAEGQSDHILDSFRYVIPQIETKYNLSSSLSAA
ncbi:MAG: hypothetical protein KME13_18530 [Myxacorys californica WJT36-NPBG1]|jgi:hypothetical protein|nr:hypothetical protein [Myxacorys californica WJT36-NPBG1]